jgi:ppGpp synthetase/RelA/SpoT-type nucleotidyltranferase
MGKSYSLDWLKSDLERSIVGMTVDFKKLKSVLQLANRYHEGQYREHKDGGAQRIPYITHPVGVAKICAELWAYADLDDSLEDILATALTHDLLEDTPIELTELETATSARTTDLVQVLTKPMATSYANRTERNRAFLGAISSHGASAKFVKVCDAIHNLSRPNSMPVSLLEKTIRKAKRDYLPLTIDPHFSDEIRQRMEEVVQHAESILAKESTKVAHYSTIETFLSYCVERSTGKILEAHDILDILLELPGIIKVHEGTIGSFEEDLLTSYLTSSGRSQMHTLATKLLEKGFLTLSGKMFSREKVSVLPYKKIMALPYEGPVKDQAHRGYFFLAQENTKSPSWVSVSSLRAVVSVLSERQRERDARELSGYANWVANSKLLMDPRLAVELRMSREQIYHLARLNDAAAIEIGAVLAAIELIGRDSGNEMLLVEHRIKSASSTATKLLKRFKGDWNKLDDVIGIRVLLINEVAVTRFMDIFNQQVNDPDSVWNSDVGLDLSTVLAKPVRSNSGYRAAHISFLVRTGLRGVEYVPCEIQVRTVFQDAWARIAHSLQYKAQGNSSRNLLRNLKKLAKMCEEADGVADQLSSGEKS